MLRQPNFCDDNPNAAGGVASVTSADNKITVTASTTAPVLQVNPANLGIPQSVNAADTTIAVTNPTGAVTIKVNPANLGIPQSVNAADTSLTIANPTGAVTIKINLANAQSWTAKQTFSAIALSAGAGDARIPFFDAGGNITTSSSFTYSGATISTENSGGNAGLQNTTGHLYLNSGSSSEIRISTGGTTRLKVTSAGCPRSTDVTSSRALNTVYQNTNTQALQVAVTVRFAITGLHGSATMQGISDSANPPTVAVSGVVGVQDGGLVGEDNTYQLVFLVKPGDYYKLVTSTANGTATLGTWMEFNY